MSDNEKAITLFTTRVRQMILQYQEMKKENAELYGMVDERDARIKQLENQLKEAQNDYQTLKTARMIEVTDGDVNKAKDRIAKLIRDVNKCITLLSE
ncbi:MAG: hypothetical protein PUG09_10000 [Prevotella sp.]|jgi:predicted nuclease with TOPRIM domain|nr:hypothetical protein [Prevotella sp.]